MRQTISYGIRWLDNMEYFFAAFYSVKAYASAPNSTRRCWSTPS